MFNSTKKGKYYDLKMEYKLLLKIRNKNLLSKGGGGDQPSLEHKVFLHFFITQEKANVPKYIFNHMIWALKESQNSNRSWIPYGRLLFEIFHQGGILKAVKQSKIITDAQLGTMTGKIINGRTLIKMELIKKEEFKERNTGLKESYVVSNLMDDFPLICRQDPPEVRAHFVYEHWERTGETIKYDEIQETMYGGALPIAIKRKSKKKATSEAVDIEEASEPKKKKAKKGKDVHQEQATGSNVPSIQEEVWDLEPAKILDKRTRSGKTVGSSQSLPPQPSISKKKRKPSIRKMKVSTYVEEEDSQVEAATDLVSRDVKRKKVVDIVALQKVLEIGKNIEVPAEVLMKESSSEQAQKVVELAENLQQLVMASELLSTAEETRKKDDTCSEAAASEATRGNSDSHTVCNAIEIESSSTSASHLTSVSTSSDIDNILLNRVYATLHKSLSPSSSTKQKKKPDDEFVLVYPQVLQSIGEMAQMRINVCARLPADHPFQPPVIQPLETILADAEAMNEQAFPEPNIPETSSSQPQPSTQTCEPNQEKASELAFDEVTLENPQQDPNSEMATNTCTKTSTSNLPTSDDQPSSSENQTVDVQPISVALPSIDSTLIQAEPDQVVIEHVVDDVATQSVTTLPSSAPFVQEHINYSPYVSDRTNATESTSSILNIGEPVQTTQWLKPGFLNQSESSVQESIQDQPSKPLTQLNVTENTSTTLSSSSNLACTPTQTSDITFPPTLLLDYIILKEACENIFKDLNKLVKTRNNFIHEGEYVNEWTSLRKRVDYMMCELQKLSLEAHDKGHADLQQWFQGVTMNLEEIELNRTLENSKLYLSDTPMYLDASTIVSSSVHSENPDIIWLTKLKVQTSDAPILEKLKDDPVLEKENKELKKAFFEHKVMVAELQRKMLDQQEQARIREENLIKSNNEFKEEMKKQS